MIDAQALEELRAIRALVAGFHAVKQIRAHAAEENQVLKRDALARLDALMLAAIVARGPETVANGECSQCGRDYSDEPALRRCPADDCPSHWEAVGIHNPEFD